MFGNLLKEKLSGAAQRLNGNTDALEAVCAACALVAAADGDIDESEVEAAIKAVVSNATLAAAFDAGKIETVASRMLDRAAAGRAGRAGLMGEIRDIKDKDKDMRELVLFASMDVADADGDVDEAEKKMLERIAAELGLKFGDYDL